MPVPSQIATAAHAYRQNGALLAKSFDGLTAEEWLSSPKQSLNPVLWIVGHVVWARAMALKLLGPPWERPWLPLFARGAKLPEPAQFPSPQEIVQGWQEVSSKLTTALESASDEVSLRPDPGEEIQASMERSAEWSASSPFTRPTTWARPPICAVGSAAPASSVEIWARAYVIAAQCMIPRRFCPLVGLTHVLEWIDESFLRYRQPTSKSPNDIVSWRKAAPDFRDDEG